MSLTFGRMQQTSESWSTTHILSLPVDLSLYLFRYTSIPDILSIRQTCKDFYRLTHCSCVWQELLKSLIEEKNIPIPGLANRSLQSISSYELETLTRKALHLHRNWTSQTPIAVNKILIKLDLQPVNRGGVAPTFEFLPGHRHRYFLTSSMLRRSGLIYSLQCWDLKTSPPTYIAQRLVQPCRGVAVNRKRGYFGQLAIHSLDIELLEIDFSSKNPGLAFITTAKICDRTDRLVTFHGSMVVSRDENHHIFLWDKGRSDSHLELRSLDETSEKALEVLVQNDVAIVIRASGLEIFATGCWCPETSKTVIYPVTQHRWQWTIDSVSMLPQTPWPQVVDRYPLINIILRFGSPLPWPVNLIHHFMLQPNLSYDSLKPVTSDNVPYEVVPVLRRQIGSPVRLFSNYHMAIGSRGTAIWIDSHTEDYFARGDCGQRLAGSIPEALKVRDDDYKEDSSTVAESSMDSSLLGYCENDDWTRVAIDEEEGRIAVGSLDGTVQVHEYIHP